MSHRESNAVTGQLRRRVSAHQSRAIRWIRSSRSCVAASKTSIAGVVLWLVGALAVSGQITLDADFDHGSLDEAGSSVAGNLVTLAGRDNDNPGNWKWLYFSATGVDGQQVTFEIDDGFATGGSDLEDHAMVYSYDNQAWQFFEHNERNTAKATFTFSNSGPFTQDQVYVAYGLPYSYERSVDHTARLAATPWVAPTLTAGSDLVIGQSPGGIDDLGRTISPRDIYGYRITDPSATGAKAKIALLSGVHANETLGSFTHEGLVDFLVGDDLQAAILRRVAEFYVYPMANPDGRFAGYNRSTVEHVTLDPNRFWDSPAYGGMSDIKVVGDAMLSDTGGDIDYFIDFHSTVVGKTGHYGLVLPAFQNDPFWRALLQLEPSVGTNDALLVNLTAAKFGRDELGAEFSITFETQFIEGENIDRFHTLGENFGRAWAEVLHTFGDLNFDGRLDEQDWLLFIAGAETDLSGMSEIDAYTSGDLDADGVNSGFDFGLFKQAFETANGDGSFAALLAAAPEPGSATLLLVAVILCGPRLIDPSVHRIRYLVDINRRTSR